MSKAKVSAMPGLREKTRLMSASEIERTLIRLAHQIIEKNNGGHNLGLVGIKRRGVPLANRSGHLITGIEKKPVDTGVLDINFYHDDLSTRDIRPVVVPGAIGFDIAGRDIILSTMFSTPVEPYGQRWTRSLTRPAAARTASGAD